MSDAPLVSLNVPAYNASRYVGQAMESLLTQSFRDFELIAIDDGSSDATGEILESFARRDPRVRVESRPNRGISATRNELLGRSRGRWIAILDADDLARPERLERQLRYLREHPDVLCVGSGYELIDSEGRRLLRVDPPETDADIQDRVLRGYTTMCQSATMIDRRALEAVGGFDASVDSAEDLDLYLKLGERGKLANVPETLVSYRIHEDSAASTRTLEMHQAARLACERAWKRRGIEGRFEPEPCRPDSSRAARYETWVKYGWWAFQSGEPSTARHYGLRAVRTLPQRLAAWRLLAVSLIKSS